MLTVNFNDKITVTAAIAIELRPADADRKVLVVQHQGEGFLWISLGGTPVVGDGIRIGPWQTVDLANGAPAAQGNGADFYVGTVDAIFQGGGDSSVQGGGGGGQTVVWVFDAE